MSNRLSLLAGVVSVMDPRFGAKGDDSTDDLPAFNAALVYLKARGGGSLYIPPPPGGTYFLNGNLNVHSPVRIFGDTGSETLNLPILRFPANVWGIVLHERRTLDNGGGNASASSGLGDASGSVLENLAIWGGGAQSFNGPYTNPANTNRAAHGVWIRCDFCRIIGCSTSFWSGNGFQVLAYSGTTGVTAGEANLNYFYNCNAQYNAGAGFYLEGSDANACVLIGCSAISCGASGFEDNSFLGNTHLGHHASHNCYLDPNSGTAPVGVCTFGGHQYFVSGSDQSTFASATQPGSVATTGASGTGTTATLTLPSLASALPVGSSIVVSGVSPAGYNGTYTVTASTTTSVSYSNTTTVAQTVAGTVTGKAWTLYDGILSSVTWAPGLTWRCSAPYLGLTTNGTANNLWEGMYTESGHPPSLVAARNLFVGGSAGVVYGGTIIDSSTGSLTSYSGFTATSFGSPTAVVYGGPSPFNTAAAGSQIYQLQYLNNTAQLSFGMDATGTLAQIPSGGPVPTMEIGLSNDTSPYGPGHYLINSLFLGPFDAASEATTGNRIQLGCLDTFPGHSYLNRTKTTVGSRFYYPTVTPGYPEGFVCTAAGALASGISSLATVQQFGRVLGATHFSSLPPSPVVGQISCVDNCSTQAWGANADGAGAFKVLVWWNGTNWTVIGK